MNKQDKETLKLTLMAFENNSLHIRDIRLRNMNYLSLEEVQALLNIEQNMNDVKIAVTSFMLNNISHTTVTHLGVFNVADEQAYNRSNNSFLHDNVA